MYPNAPIKVLFLAAKNNDDCGLKLEQQLNQILDRLNRTKRGQTFIFEQRRVESAEELAQAILEVKPQIAHFSGRGLWSGEICFENANGDSVPLNPQGFKVFISTG